MSLLPAELATRYPEADVARMAAPAAPRRPAPATHTEAMLRAPEVASLLARLENAIVNNDSDAVLELFAAVAPAAARARQLQRAIRLAAFIQDHERMRVDIVDDGAKLRLYPCDGATVTLPARRAAVLLWLGY